MNDTFLMLASVSNAPPFEFFRTSVENPSARWSVYDCLRLPEGDRPAVCSDGSYPKTIQEMAWTSPIWHEAR